MKIKGYTFKNKVRDKLIKILGGYTFQEYSAKSQIVYGKLIEKDPPIKLRQTMLFDSYEQEEELHDFAMQEMAHKFGEELLRQNLIWNITTSELGAIHNVRLDGEVWVHKPIK